MPGPSAPAAGRDLAEAVNQPVTTSDDARPPPDLLPAPTLLTATTILVAAASLVVVALRTSMTGASGVGWDIVPFVLAVALIARRESAVWQRGRVDWVRAASLSFILAAFLAFGPLAAAVVAVLGFGLGAALRAARGPRRPGVRRPEFGRALRPARIVIGVLAGAWAASAAVGADLGRAGDDTLTGFAPFLATYLTVQLAIVLLVTLARAAPATAGTPAWALPPGLNRRVLRDVLATLTAAAIALVIDAVGLRLEQWIAALLALAVMLAIHRVLVLNVELAERNRTLARALSELRTLNAVGEVLTSTIEPDRLIEGVATQVGGISGADTVMIGLVDPARTRVRVAFHSYGGTRQPERFEVMPDRVAPDGTPTGSSPGDGLLARVLATGQTVVGEDTETFPLDRPDGTPLPAGRSGVRHFPSAIGVPLIAAGELIGVMAIKSHRPDQFSPAVVHLLAQVAGQAALALRNAGIVASERAVNQARSDFLTTVSHELRTPITAISGYAQLLARRFARDGGADTGRESSSSAAMMDIILKQSRHLTRLVDDLVSLSSLGQGTTRFDMGPVDLSSILDEVLARATGRSEGDQSVAPAVDAGIEAGIVVEGDREALREVIGGLIGNALTHGDGRGAVEVSLVRQGPMAELRVMDHGPGIPLAQQRDIFQPFFRGAGSGSGPAARPGLGLGLSIAREIVAAHGGSIGVISEAGRGATFIVRLPLRRAGGAGSSGPAGPAGGGPG